MSQQSANDLYSQLDEETKKFYEFHGVQLIGINFPPKADLITKLYKKLKDQIFDAGNFFKIIDNEDDEKYQYSALFIEKFLFFKNQSFGPRRS